MNIVDTDTVTQDYFNRMDKCGMKMHIRGRTVIHRCNKEGCPQCGGKDNLIHRHRRSMVDRRTVNMSMSAGRSLVFTVPTECRKYFMSREGLNKFFKIVNRVIHKTFGVQVGEKKKKKGIERVYRLTKPVFATLHLFGDGPEYHPHINVIILEKYPSESLLFISKSELKQIKTSYKKALERSLKQEIDNVVVHYSYVDALYYAKKLIYYVTRPMQPEIPWKLAEQGNSELIGLLLKGLKGFQKIRFWGEMSNCKYKKVEGS
jgi:hypothetical protein